MISSMTGFGQASAQGDRFGANVEARSVNHRHRSIRVNLPDTLSDFEPRVRDHIKQTITRGRVTISVDVETVGGSQAVELDEEAVRTYATLLRRLRETAAIDQPISVADLLEFSDVFTPVLSGDEAAQQAWSMVEEALVKALDSLVDTRRQEGKELESDLRKRVDQIEEALQKVRDRTDTSLQEKRDHLARRLEDLMDDQSIDEDRLEQEIVILADKQDITEECVRLESHVSFFREALDSSDPIGRRLKFLAQEMHREINTIGSKANDAEISQFAVEMKEELEKIREQIQNIE